MYGMHECHTVHTTHFEMQCYIYVIVVMFMHMFLDGMHLRAYLVEMTKEQSAKQAAKVLLRSYDFVLSQFEARIVACTLDPILRFILWCQGRTPKAHLVYDYVHKLIDEHSEDVTIATVSDSIRAQWHYITLTMVPYCTYNIYDFQLCPVPSSHS